MKIGHRQIGNGAPCFIIAEAGTNHASENPYKRLGLAYQYLDAAQKAGVDAVKFQLFVKSKPLFCPVTGDDGGWKRWGHTLMGINDWVCLRAEAERQGLVFLASAFQKSGIEIVRGLGVEAYKVASRAALSYPYDEVPGPFIVSVAPEDPPPWQKHTDKEKEYVLLRCVPDYPCPLARAVWYRDGWTAGISDHSGTVFPALDAMAHGAAMIEVHFAIDKAHAGPDAPVCLTVDQLKLLCEARDAFAEMKNE